MTSLPLVILAGGAGTRLGLTDKPKPMADICGKPLLQRQFELARLHGYTDIILLTGYMSDVIEECFGAGQAFNVNLEYWREPRPLGTAGGFPFLRSRLSASRFLVFYGDVAMDFDLSAFVDFDSRHPDSLGTLIAHPNNHPHDSDLIEIDADSRIRAFHAKPHPEGAWRKNLSNAAVYCLSPKILDYIGDAAREDWAHDVFPRVLAGGKPLYAYQTAEYIKDMGTPERYAAVNRDWRNNRHILLHRAKPRAAAFFDRDGVLNYDVGNLADIDKFELIPGAAEAVRRVNEQGMLAVVVTNQPVVAKGWLDEGGLARIHAKLETLLGREGAYLDRIYYCPHHPERGFDGERPELKFACDCRKPQPGMILRAKAELNIDLARSVLFGDRDVDIASGRAGGVGECVRIGANTPQELLLAVNRWLSRPVCGAPLKDETQ